MTPIRVLLVDDSPEFLQATSRFLSVDPSLEIIGENSSAKEALDTMGQLKPDLILMDLAMPETNGLEATRIVKSKKHPPRVIILTMHDNTEYRSAAQSVHADGFVSKSELGLKLIPMIHKMFEDRVPVLQESIPK